MVFGVLQRVTGVDLLRDLSVFFRSLGGMIDGFTERAARVGALLEDPATTFLIVTAPRHDPVEEAIFFHRKLREAGMPFGGLVVNRVHQPADGRRAAGRAVADGARRRRWPSASARRDATSWPRWPRATPRTSHAACATRARRSRRRSSSPSSRTTCTTSTGSRWCAHTCSRLFEAVGSRLLALARAVGERAQRRVEVAAEHVAQDRPQAAAELLDERLDLRRRAHEAGHRGALERDRLAHALLERGAVVAPRRRSRRAARRRRRSRRVGVGEQRAGGEQPVGERLDGAAALAAELEAAQRPGQLAGARRAAGDEPAERAQRVLLLGA